MLVSAGDFLDDVCVGNRSVHLVVRGSMTFCGQPVPPDNRLSIVDLLRDVPRGGLARRFRRHGCAACVVVVSEQIRAQVDSPTADASAQEESCAPCTFTDRRETSV